MPVIPPGTDTGMPLDLPPGTETQKTAEPVNPLDEVFGGALEAYRGRDYVTARDLWGELTDAGHELSTHNLAVLLWRGQGGPQDRQEAFDLFHAAEELKVAESAHALGVIHLRGLGVAKNPTIAMQHFEKGSEMGHGPSTYNLAVAHLKGIGVPADPDHGMELMTAAAEGGLTRAQYDLANLLVRGTYGTPNPAAARDWYARAAAGGDPFAHYNLAVMYQDGVGGKADLVAAEDHLRKAAGAGVVPAQRQLGYVLATRGGKKNFQDAMGWFLVAASFGDETSKTNAQRLKPRLDPKAQKAAEAWARDLQPTPLEVATKSNETDRQEKVDVGILAKVLKFSVKLAVFVGCIAVLISYARLTELGDLRKELMERIANSYAGRLTIGGEVDLKLTFPPSISIGDVRIRNADWGTKPDMLVAKQLVAEVDFLPLLRGDMAVPRLTMIGVDIVVEQRPDGTTNWDDLSKFETAAGPANPVALPSILPSVGGAGVSVAGGTLTVMNSATPASPTVVSLGGGTISGGSGGAPCL